MPAPLREPVRILSDLHLAHPASEIRTVDSLRPLLEGAGTVVFNGDTCELSCADWRARGEEQLQELRELCEAEGVATRFLAGNHDPGLTEEGWLELESGKIAITHGHALYWSVAPWSPEFVRNKRKIRELFESRREFESSLAGRWETTRMVTELLKPTRARSTGKRGRLYLLSAFWPPERCFQILRVWFGMVRAADRFAGRYFPASRFLLFGHFHRSGIWTRGGRTLCNTGAFMRGSKPLLAELRDRQVTVKDVVARDGLFLCGPAKTVVNPEDTF